MKRSDELLLFGFIGASSLLVGSSLLLLALLSRSIGNVLYAAILLLNGFVWGRRWRRAHRASGWEAAGLCPACGYDLRASPDRCPECGVAITQSN